MSRRPARRLPRRPGITLVEVVISLGIIAVMFAATMHTVAGAKATTTIDERRATAQLLAHDLLATVFAKEYEDASVLPAFGREPLEVLVAKPDLDDVDDFNGWSESPPQDESGNVIPGYSGWSRTVQVTRVMLESPDTEELMESGGKRIEVIVRFAGKELARSAAIRSDRPPPTSN